MIAFPRPSPESLRRYRERRIKDLERLVQASRVGDYRTLCEVGHRIKGNAAVFGLQELGVIAKDLEDAAGAADTSRISWCLARFETAVSQIPC